jgi:hypothetical protein
VTDHPIIFSAPMVRALLDGRKTMTRRLAWGKPVGVDVDEEAARDLRRDGWKVSGPDDTEHRIAWRRSPWQRVQPGDRLWVRETWRTGCFFDSRKPSDIDVAAPISFDADGLRNGLSGKTRVAIHMPRWASRLTLIVTGTKIERLHDITVVEAMKEGIGRRVEPVDGVPTTIYSDDFDIGASECPRDHFRLLWIWLHGKESWDANPEVVAITFAVT